MRKNFTNAEKQKGELAVRELSEKAQEFYYSCFDLKVYSVRVASEDVALLEDEKEDEFVTRYFTRGDYADRDYMTLTDLDKMLSELADENK